MSDRIRVLLVTRNLPPLLGGMERLNSHILQELHRSAEIRVVGPAGAGRQAPAGAQVTEVPLTPLWRFLVVSLWRARREARSWRPDVVLAGSGLTAVAACWAARACGAAAVAYVHGLDVAVPNRLYRAVWWPALRRMQRVVANSAATARACSRAGIDAARIAVVHPGVALPPPDRDADERARDFRRRRGLGDAPLLLSVGRLTQRKGLREFVTHALPRIAAQHPDAIVAVIGSEGAQALHSRVETEGDVRAAAERVGLASSIRFLGTVDDSELVDAYRAADVHIFPVREIPGDPEGFGMVAIEAAAHGLPTVAFAVGGVPDAVRDGESGRLVRPGDHLAFAAAVTDLLDRRGALRKPCIAFAQQFAWPVFGARLLAQLEAARSGRCPR